MPINHNIIAGTSWALVPNGYKIIEIIFENHEGRKIDIVDLVIDFEISESIYSTYNTLKLKIKDYMGLLEEYEISGQETITIVFEKEDYFIGLVRRTKKFYVTEYPEYIKSPAARVQGYLFEGVSEHAFLSQFKKISRSMTGEIKNIIRDILIKDLNISPDRIIVTPVESPKINVVIPNFFPIKAIHWLLRRCFDPTGGPFYVYETIDDKIRIDAHVDMVQRNYYRKYEEGRHYTYDPEFHPKEDYWQRLVRMLNIESDIKLTKFLPGSAGAYSSTTEYLDMSIKTYSKEDFNYYESFPEMIWLDKYRTVSSLFKIKSEGKRIYEMPDVYTNRISLNYEANNGLIDNYHQSTYFKKLNKAISYEENFDSFLHDIRIHGDPTIYSGKKLNLHFVQPIDPELGRKGYENNINPDKDIFVSGDYIITSVKHLFSEKYYQEIRTKKDTYSEPLED